jgi:hypothetical protein
VRRFVKKEESKPATQITACARDSLNDRVWLYKDSKQMELLDQIWRDYHNGLLSFIRRRRSQASGSMAEMVRRPRGGKAERLPSKERA